MRFKHGDVFQARGLNMVVRKIKHIGKMTCCLPRWFSRKEIQSVVDACIAQAWEAGIEMGKAKTAHDLVGYRIAKGFHARALRRAEAWRVAGGIA